MEEEEKDIAQSTPIIEQPKGFENTKDSPDGLTVDQIAEYENFS